MKTKKLVDGGGEMDSGVLNFQKRLDIVQSPRLARFFLENHPLASQIPCIYFHPNKEGALLFEV